MTGAGEEIWPIGESVMAREIRARDWSTHPLGPTAQWPAALRSTVELMLPNGFPMIVLWGRDLHQIYNDGYRDLMNDKHPRGLGQRTQDCWPEVWHINGPIYDRVFAGETVTVHDGLYPLTRNGRLSDAWFNLSYSPVRDETGRIAGVFIILVETTARHVAETRRDAVAASLRDSEHLLSIVFDAMPVGVGVFDAQGQMTLSNTEMRRYLPNGIMPSRDPEMSRRWRARDTDGRVLPPEQYPGARALRGERVLPGVEFAYDQPDGREIWLRLAAAPLSDARGEVTGAVLLIADVDALKSSAEALRVSEERLRKFGEASGDVLWICDAITRRADYLTPAFEDTFGLDRTRAMQGDFIETWLALVVEEDRAAARAAADRLLQGERVAFEYRIRRASDGETRWLRNTDFPMFGPDGALRSIGGIGRDVTDEKRVAERLATNEESLRSAAEVGQLGLWDWNLRTGAASWSDHHFRIQGYAVREVPPSFDAWVSRLHPDDREATIANLCAARDARAEFVQEYRVLHPDRSVHWVSARGRFFYDEAGAPVRMVGAMLETTERRIWEERQSVMIAELQHRTRNLIAVVRGISNQSARAKQTLADYLAVFHRRLEALSRVQGLLSRADVEPITVRAMLQLELDALGADAVDGAVSLNGPDVRIRSAVAQTLSLAIHELVTNAHKYGALATPRGRLSIDWTQHKGEDGRARVRLIWTETGLARCPDPERVGYGRQLIERALPYSHGATTDYRLEKDAVFCMIDLPLAR